MEAIRRLFRRITSSTEKRTISFGESERQFVEIYLPRDHISSKGALPLLIFVHGGAWVSENVGMYKDLAQYIASKGVAVALPEYRLTRYKDVTPENPNTIWHPNHLEDVYAGIRMVYANAEKLGYTTEQTVLVGHSAGGYMNLAVALDSTEANDEKSDSLIRDLPRLEASIVKSIKAFVCVVSMPQFNELKVTGILTYLCSSGEHLFVGRYAKAVSHLQLFHHACVLPSHLTKQCQGALLGIEKGWTRDMACISCWFLSFNKSGYAQLAHHPQ